MAQDDLGDLGVLDVLEMARHLVLAVMLKGYGGEYEQKEPGHGHGTGEASFGARVLRVLVVECHRRHRHRHRRFPR